MYTLIVAAMATVSAMAQMNGAMKFAGKAEFYISQGDTRTGYTANSSDTIVYEGANFTLPGMTYGNMAIPPFTIKGTQYTGGYDGVTWPDQTWSATVADASGAEKTITGTSLAGSFTHTGGIYKLNLSVTFSYGAMPMPITYSIEGYYVKRNTAKVSVTIGGKFGPYTCEAANFDTRLYHDGDGTKLDIAMHGYSLDGTVMGNIAIGGYTVKALEYSEDMGGYYRNYANDGLKVHIKASQGGTSTMDADYSLSEGSQNILVKTSGTSVDCAVNNFRPGAMPFPITATFGNNLTAGISQHGAGTKAAPAKRMENGRMVIERNGRKYSVAGILLQ